MRTDHKNVHIALRVSNEVNHLATVSNRRLHCDK